MARSKKSVFECDRRRLVGLGGVSAALGVVTHHIPAFSTAFSFTAQGRSTHGCRNRRRQSTKQGGGHTATGRRRSLVLLNPGCSVSIRRGFGEGKLGSAVVLQA